MISKGLVADMTLEQLTKLKEEEGRSLSKKGIQH